MYFKDHELNKNLAYIVGVALGDGNLSNANGRAVRLRVSCHNKYPEIIKQISHSLHTILPTNKVSLVIRPRNCIDVSCHSNKLENWLGGKAKNGSKFKQSACVPGWIKANRDFTTECLRGLLQTDGSIYNDRGYIMVNFTSIIPSLANDAMELFQNLGFQPRLYIKPAVPEKNRQARYTIRLSKNAAQFIDLIKLEKR